MKNSNAHDSLPMYGGPSSVAAQAQKTLKKMRSCLALRIIYLHVCDY